MGKHQSKENNENGDIQLTVIQDQQQQHSADHEEQTLLLWLILVTVLIHLAITLYKMYKKREKSIAVKAARSVAAIV